MASKVRGIYSSVRATVGSYRAFATDKETIAKQEELLFPRTLETIKEGIEVSEKQTSNEQHQEKTDKAVTEQDEIIDDWPSEKKLPLEVGFKYEGPEPTRFGDWQHKGRTTDF